MVDESASTHERRKLVIVLQKCALLKINYAEVSTATQIRSMATILGSKYATTYFDSNYGSSVRKRYANFGQGPQNILTTFKN